MTDEKKHYLILSIIFLVIIFIGIAGIVGMTKSTNVAPASILDLNPSPSISPTAGEENEPVPFSWEEYTNDEYNFTLSYPTGWNKQVYKDEQKKGLTVAFSPDILPCETCTYFFSGYYSIKVYNQTTDAEAYAHFRQRLAAIGKVAGYQPVQLDGRQGVFSGNSVAVENNGWVFELSLDKNGGKAAVADSQIFKKVLSSFKFTNLIFNK